MIKKISCSLETYFPLMILLSIEMKFVYPVSLNGFYTSKIKTYNLVVPHKLTFGGDFLSFHIPQFFKHDLSHSKAKRSLDDEDRINYGIKFQDEKFHVVLWPNHEFLSPDVITEKRDPKRSIKEREVCKVDTGHLCHYIGIVKNVSDSRAAFSTCNGLAGYMTVGDKIYFIEPLKNHQANEHGHHLHLIYERNVKLKGSDKQCGVTTNWRNAWRENLKNKFISEKSSVSGKSKRESKEVKDIDRYLELLVVCDKKFINYHKQIHDIETYILTIMNMLSELFHDPSIGFDISAQVVRIIYLEKEQDELDLSITSDANETLKSFCNWQRKINPLDIKNPNHHDIAVLITRHDICGGANSTDCGVMGLSYIGTPCVEDKSCAINEDNGLILAFVMAHEIGHVMGCAHDETNESGCDSKDKDGSFFIMAPNVHIYTIRWSACSKAFIEDLFENELGECLFDKPEISLYRQTSILPGVVYDGQAQCEMIYPGSHLEIYDEDKFCEELFCRLNATYCASTGESLVDGTKCGENKWCFQKRCIEAGERPKAINGGWGDWSAATPCSRTCGGGVTMTERECNNPIPANGGRYCLGDHEKFWICNTKPCPIGGPTFRDEQCAEGNTKTSEGPWRAYFNIDEPCVLFCINDESIVRKIQPRAKDGTPCKPGTKYTCISGVCTKVGCDFVINSDAVEDHCGICKGDGTECQIEEQYFNETGQDYQEVVRFPADSRNILVEEMGKSPNIIALKDKSNNRFILNGDYKESPDITFEVDKTEAVYRHPEPDREILAIKGPLATEKILHVCFFKPLNVGYKYRYARMIVDGRKIGLYHWEVLEYEKCTANCEGGIQEPIIDCVEEKGGKVSHSFCKHVKKIKAPALKCNEHRCATRWRVGKWGKCHACEFQSGIRLRCVECVKESPHPGADEVLVDDNECDGPRPATRELCNAVKVCRCRRKTTLGVPNRLLRDVWKQIRDAKSVEKQESMDNEIDFLREIEKSINGFEINKDNSPKIMTQTNLDVTSDIPKRKSTTIASNISSEGRSNEEQSICKIKLDDTCEPKIKSSRQETCTEKLDENIESICEEPAEKECKKILNECKAKKKLWNIFHLSTDDEEIFGCPNKTPCNVIDFPPDMSQDECEKAVKVNVGDIIMDKKDSIGTQIKEIPYKETSLTINASDSAFEDLGDVLGDTLLTGQTKTISGKEARKEIKKIQHKLKQVKEEP